MITAVRGLAMALALAACLAGCQSSEAKIACWNDGKGYAEGESFPSSDGCNTCQCTSVGEVACTLMACLGDASFHPPGDDARANSNDAALVCTRGTTVIPAGQSVNDGCNTCMCSEQGVLSCTGRICLSDPAPDAGSASCTLATALTFGWNGGMVVYQDENVLDPKAGLTITRSYSGRSSVDGAALRSCSPPLPACGAAGVVSLSTISADLAATDVQVALAKGKGELYGTDTRPVDGPVWSIALANGGSILVGSPCASSGTASCVAIPAGIQRLTDDLESLVSAALQTTECKDL
jgi:hypothetical protein